jgi:SAP domain
MTVYARSDIAAVSISAIHGGIAHTHSRPVEDGAPARIWALTCDLTGCEDFLRHSDQWSSTVSEIPETYDEKLKREDFEKRGALDERKLMAMALAQLCGLPVPDTISGAISGMMPHIAGVLECASCGSGQPSGAKFCNGCGSPMSTPVSKAALDAPQRPAEPPAAAPSPNRRAVPQRLQDLRHDELQAACRARGLPDQGVRKDLMKRLRNAGVTNADIQRLLVAA